MNSMIEEGLLKDAKMYPKFTLAFIGITFFISFFADINTGPPGGGKTTILTSMQATAEHWNSQNITLY